MINETITTQTKRFHHVKLIIHYIKRLFENKKGIIKILIRWMRYFLGCLENQI